MGPAPCHGDAPFGNPILGGGFLQGTHHGGTGPEKKKRPAQTAVLKKETAMKPPKGAVVFIYGAPMDIPPRRSRPGAPPAGHGAPRRHGPEPLVISKRLMTQGQI